MTTSATANNGRPAILGGEPAFAQRVPIVRPALPAFSEMSDDIAGLLDSGMVTKGQHLTALEKEAAEHLDVEHVVGVSSCTSGLMLVYRGLDLEGEVIVPSFTFMASVSSLVWAGLRPVFVDCDRSTFNIDVEAAQRAITPRTTAIVAVHNFGNPADIAALEDLASRHSLKLIFDAAHGLGTEYRGSPVGGQGDAQLFSMSPTKLLIAGEGGLVATNDGALADKVRMGREYGMAAHYDSSFAGINARLPEFSALLARHSLRMLDKAVHRRQELATHFETELRTLPGVEFQRIEQDCRSSYKDFAIVIDPDRFGLTRDALTTAMAAENIDTRQYYNPPVHQQTAYRQFAPGDSSLAHSEQLSERILCLPLWSHMDDEMCLRICAAIRRIQNSAAAVAETLEGVDNQNESVPATTR